MPRQSRYIRKREAAEILGVSPRTVLNLGFKQYPLNPHAKRPTWMFERKEVEAFIDERVRQSR